MRNLRLPICKNHERGVIQFAAGVLQPRRDMGQARAHCPTLPQQTGQRLRRPVTSGTRQGDAGRVALRAVQSRAQAGSGAIGFERQVFDGPA